MERTKVRNKLIIMILWLCFVCPAVSGVCHVSDGLCCSESQWIPWLLGISPDGWAVWDVVLSTRWWLLVDHCVLWNWDRILVSAVKGLISRAGMVSICPLLWQRDVKLQQTKPWLLGPVARSQSTEVSCMHYDYIVIWGWISTIRQLMCCESKTLFYIHYINMCFEINTTKIFGKNALNILFKVCLKFA